MLARGDFAAEYGGNQRLAGPREGDPWLGEPEHLPAITATQVPERERGRDDHSGPRRPTPRLGQRGERVLLNKGRHILDTVIALDDILWRPITPGTTP